MISSCPRLAHRIAGTLFAASQLLLVACGGADDAEARLRRTIAAMEEAAESGDRGEFLSYVASDFGGQGGRLDRRGLGDLLRVQLLRHSRVSAAVTFQEIQLFESGRARAKMRVLLTGGPRAWLPESGQVYSIETGWRESDDGWQLISARWEPL